MIEKKTYDDDVDTIAEDFACLMESKRDILDKDTQWLKSPNYQQKMAQITITKIHLRLPQVTNHQQKSFKSPNIY